eukprot:gene3766-4689_t
MVGSHKSIQEELSSLNSSNNNNNNKEEMEEEITIESVQNLIKQRSALELELEQLKTFLTSGPGATFGFNGSFVDRDGYPSPHLDLIIEVKKARNRIACIQTDYKLLMKKIEKDLELLHSKSKSTNNNNNNNNTPKSSSSSPPSSTTTTTNNQQQQQREEKENVNNKQQEKEEKEGIPFVYIDLVSPGSPAEKAGFLKGDFIYQFGSVGPIYSLDNSTSYLQTIATLVRNSENKPITIKFFRNNNQKITTSLVPKKWTGQGLIGNSVE